MDELKQTDEDLVLFALENPHNFSFIMQRYEDKLRRYIFRISNIPADDVEDVLQEVFIKVYRNLNSFDQSLKFSSWIYRITHNEVISNYRKLKSRGEKVYEEINEEVLKNLMSDINHEKEIDISYLRKNIEQVLDKMDIKYREVLVLRFFEEKEYAEISDILKKPMGTVATLINRAKKQFKDELAKQDIKF